MESGLFTSLGTGGPIVVVLALLSFLSIGLIVVKTLQLLPVRSGGDRRDTAIKNWTEGNKDKALQSVHAGSSPADRVLAFAMSGTKKGIARGPLEAEVERRGNSEVQAMSRHIRLIELIAMISPLLGLLGTVLGMIQSFQELELAEGAANASVLAGGIWQALLTTAAGLVVAIPAAVGAALLSSRVEAGTQEIETAVGQFFLAEDTP